jgi:hypothetical protein
VKYIAGSVIEYGRWVQVGVWTVVIGSCLGAAGGWFVTREVAESVDVEVEDPEGETKEGDNTSD